MSDISLVGQIVMLKEPLLNGKGEKADIGDLVYVQSYRAETNRYWVKAKNADFTYVDGRVFGKVFSGAQT